MSEDTIPLISVKVSIVITLYFWLIEVLAYTAAKTGLYLPFFRMQFGLPTTSVLVVNSAGRCADHAKYLPSTGPHLLNYCPEYI